MGLFSGPRHGPSWLSAARDMDFFEAKGAVESLLSELHVAADYRPDEDPVFHPGKSARVVIGAGYRWQRGRGASQSPGPLRTGHWSGRHGSRSISTPCGLLCPEFSWRLRGYHPLSRVGARSGSNSRRDVPSAAIQRIVERHKLVKTGVPFDVYTGPGVPAGKKSIAYKIVFSIRQVNPHRRAVDTCPERHLRQLQRDLGAVLRE